MPLSQFKVVIVDDEILAIQHIKQLICWEDYGFQVAGEASNPEKALAICEKVEPDVVFVDIRMPVMNGLEFSKRLLRAGRPVKIILLTSYKEFEYAREAVKIGAFDYLLKHEMDGEGLAAELGRIKSELESEKQKERFIRRQVLTDMAANRKPAEQQLEQGLQFTKLLGDQFL
ncbi:MAG: helix-turn-helix protein [Paenibacillus sp.]|nr:helix-turn-helix protein [Paenibacillus sp.]